LNHLVGRRRRVDRHGGLRPPWRDRRTRRPGASSGEEAQLVLEVKEQLYRNWPDQPLPVLAGLTPSRAVRTAAGREAVDLLLREMENREQRAGGAAYDLR